MYLKLSIRNAKRSFTNYLLYLVTMTVLLAVLEVSNCIAIAGESAGFQAISLPLLLTLIQILLVGYIDTFLLKQRAKEFANYLLLGMGKKKLANLFLCETLLLGCCCCLAGITIGFAAYGFFCFHAPLQEFNLCRFLFGKSMLHTLGYFFLMEMVCSFRLKQRFSKLQIRELIYEKNRSQQAKKIDNYKKWGALFFSCFTCLLGLMFGIVFLPENYSMYAISVVTVPLAISVFAFYRWMFGYLYAKRYQKPASLYQKNRLYLMADITSNFKTEAIGTAVFCMCFLFSAGSYITGRWMLQPKFQIFGRASQQWMGAAQISSCVVFTVIYFSILSLQQMTALKQNARDSQIMRYLGNSSRQLEILIHQQAAIKLTFPMIMAFVLFLTCMPLLNRKLNLIMPAPMHNALFKFTGEFLIGAAFFYVCYFGIVNAVGRRCLTSSARKNNSP